MGSSAIFNGAYVKLLKDQLKLKDSARILTGTDDPTSVAKEGETGSIYLKQAVNTVIPDTFSALGAGLGWVYSITTYNNELYAGGAGGLFKWNGTSWVNIPFSPTYGPTIFALEVYNNELYLAGSWGDVTGISGGNHILKYNGSTYSSVGTSPATSTVLGLKAYKGNLYLCSVSSFSGLGSQVAIWNGSAYSSVGPINGSSVRTFGIYNNDLYIGGEFTNAAGVSGADRIVRFDGTTFTLVGTASTIYTGQVDVFQVYNNELYIGGFFSSTVSNGILKWNGTSFLVPGTSPGTYYSQNNYPQAMGVLGSFLYVGGGNVASTKLTRFDGTTYTPVGLGAGATPFEIFPYNNELWIGGALTDIAGIPDADGIVKLTPTYSVNTPAKIYTKTDNGTTTNWKELVDTFNNQTIGGDKTFTGNMSFTGTLGNTVIDVSSATNALRVTQRGTGNAILVEDSANPDSTPFVVDASGNTSIGADATVTGALKLGADARIIRGTDDPTVVAKEGETGSIYLKQAVNTLVPEAISALGTGINSNTFEAVECIAVYNNEVYVGGSFTTANGAPANYLAKWNGTSWVSVGTVNNRVVALKVYNNELYLGGNFTNINGVTGASYLAKWNGTTFSTVGGGSNFFNTVVAFEVYNNELYIGGYFTGGGGVSGADFIVKYNGSTFSLVGPAYSLNSQVRALAVYGSDLYIGGNFTNTGGFICVYFVRWDGSAFSVPAGNANAFNGQVLALAAHSGKLYIGGGFTGNVGARLVSWNGTTYATLSGTNLNNEVNALISHSGSLYIGGNFSDAFGITGASDLVRYDGTSFYAVGAANAFNSTYGVVAFATNNSTLYIGGYFNNVNGAANTGKVVSYVPSYTISAPAKIYTKTDAGTTTNWKELVDTFNDQTIGGNKTFTGLVNSLTANQDRGLKMIEGGVWTYSSSSPSNQVTNLTGSTSTLFSMSPTGANNSAVGQSFTPSSAFIPSSLVVSLLRLNNPTGNVRIDIYNDNAGTPGSVIASSNEVLASSIATSATDYTFTFSTPVLLSASTLYYFMLVPGAGYTSDSNNNIRTAGATSNVYAGGQVVYRQNSTGTWVSYAGDTRFNIIGYVQQLSFTATAYIQVPGLPNVRNTITTAQSPISIANGQAAYVNINRTGTASSNLTVSVANIDAIDATNGNLVIIARGTSDGVFVGTSTDKLAPGQSSTLESIGTILANVTTAALKVTQTGTGDAILVEDEVSDTTPFVVKADGNVGIGTSSPTTPLHVNGSIRFGTGGAYLTSSAGDNFQLFTGTNSPNPNFVIGMGNGSGAVDTSRAYLVGEGGSSPGRMTFVGATFGVGPNHPDVTTPPFRVTTAGTTIINVNSSSDALKITQAGTGNALLVEDEVSDTTPFVVKADGKVGVGILAPESTVHINQNAGGALGANLVLSNMVNGSTGTAVAIDFGVDNSTTANGQGNAQIKVTSVDGASAAADMTFSTWNGSSFGERVRISSVGNVGVGTTSPSERLHVNGNGRFDGTGAVKVSSGLTSERPGTPINGMIRYNTETAAFEGYASNAWSEVGGSTTRDRVTQASHGFVVGDVLYLNGSTYTKASASAAATSEVVGVVSRIIDANTFDVTLNGEISGLTASSYTENALPAAGEAVFLAPTIVSTTPSSIVVSQSGFYSASIGNSSQFRGQTFTSPATVCAISSISVGMNRAGSVETNNVYVDVWQTSANKPSTLVATSNPVPKNSVPTGSYGLQQFTFPSTIVLNPSTLYAFSVRVEGTFSNGLAMIQNDPGTYAQGDYVESTDGGATWYRSTTSDLNTFTIAFQGVSVSGKLTITEPSVVGQVSLPVGVASGSGTLYVLPKRGAVVGGANARTLVGLANNTSTSIQLVTAYDAGELTGWVDLPNSTPANSKKFYVQVQFAKNGPGTDYNVAFQTTGDTPPAGFNVDYSGGYVRVTLPNVSGLTNASINFALNAPAVGATLPLAIDSENVMFGTVKPKDANGINVRNFANTATNLSIADTGVVSFFNAINFDYTAVTSATTLNTTHYYVSASGSTTYAITLPTAVGVQGRVYIVKSNMNAGVLLTVNTTSSQTIDGATSRSLARFESLQVISNGSNWEVF